MEEQIFTDGVGRISVIGGIVRIDLVTYSATETDHKGQPRAILTHRLVMGTDGFVRAAEQIAEAALQVAQKVPVIPAAAPQPRPQPPAPQPAPQPAPVAEKPATPAPQPAPSPWSASSKPPFP